MGIEQFIYFAVPILIGLSVSLGYFLTEKAWGQCMMMVVGLIVVVSELFKNGA